MIGGVTEIVETCKVEAFDRLIVNFLVAVAESAERSKVRLRLLWRLFLLARTLFLRSRLLLRRPVLLRWLLLMLALTTLMFSRNRDEK